MLEISIIITGICLALIATICFNLAFVLQKKGVMQAPEIKFDEGISGITNSFKAFFKNKFWMAGAILGVIGWFPYIFAMGYIGILVVQPVMSVGLIIFVIAALFILDEKLTVREYLSIGFLILAMVLIVLAGISEVRINLYNIVLTLIIFLLICISIGVVLFTLSLKKRDTELEAHFITFTTAIIYPLGAIFTNILAQALIDSGINPLFFWEILFGIFYFDYFYLWVFLGFWGMVFFNIVSLILLQSALQKGKAVFVIPIQNIFVLILPLIAGIFIFQQTFENYFLFIIAIFLIMISVVILSRFQAKFELIEKK